MRQVLLGVVTSLSFLAVVDQLRRRSWWNVMAYGVPCLLGLAMTVAAASGVLFVGPGGHGGVGVP